MGSESQRPKACQGRRLIEGFTMEAGGIVGRFGVGESGGGEEGGEASTLQFSKQATIQIDNQDRNFVINEETTSYGPANKAGIVEVFLKSIEVS